MLQETWNTFPRQIVQKINGLLEQAMPTSIKSFHFYKHCKSENLWDKSFSEFSYWLSDYYQRPIHERSKSQIDQFLNRPMNYQDYETLSLTFRTANIEASEIRNIASWAHHMLRLHYEKISDITSVEALNQTIHDLTHPSYGAKDHSLDFEDFCEAWKDAANKLYGKKFESEHMYIISELRHLNFIQEKQILASHRQTMLNGIYLTQTEITWVERALSAVKKGLMIPRYPLSKGPTKNRLIDLLKWTTLWQISKDVKAVAVQAQVIKLRDHIEQECEDLLAKCRR